MKIAILTQDDGIFSYQFLKPFFEVLSKNNFFQITSVNLSRSTASGRKETTTQKIRKMLEIFGISFVLYTVFRYAWNICLNKNVRKLANNFNVPLYNLTKGVNSRHFHERLKNEKADLVVIVAGTEIVKEKTLKTTKYGFINCHSSLLPSNKGLMPVFWSLLNEKTGFTWYALDEGIDTGSVLLQQKVEVQTSFVKQLIITKEQSAHRMIEAIEILIGNKNVVLVPNHRSSYNKFPDRNNVIELRKKIKLF